MRESDYRLLASFRQHIRGYLRFSELAAREAGIEAQQYQCLLALKGLPAGTKPTIRELATRLMIEHHSAVGLVDRLEKNGLIARTQDSEDHRQIIVHLTAYGKELIAELASVHAEELRKTAPELIRALSQIVGVLAGTA